MKKTRLNTRKHTTTQLCFLKDNEILFSMYLEKQLVHDKFEMGKITLHTDGENIYIGECMWHDENSLDNTWDKLMGMYIELFDFDVITKNETISSEIKLVKDAD